MCGIVAVIGSREASPLLLEGLRHLEYRGYDSAGLATIEVTNNKEDAVLTTRKAKGKLINLEGLVNKDGAKGRLGIGHTRWATHGKPEIKNAHPHLDRSGKIALVQNGIIENHIELRKQLISQGIQFSSQTDTEVIPHLISIQLEKYLSQGLAQNRSTFLKAVQSVLPLLKGTYAIAVIWLQCPDVLVVARRNAPLLIGFGEGEFFCASDTPALLPFTRTVLPLEDNEIALLTPIGIELFDSLGQRNQRTPTLINGFDQIADKKHFKHFMLKEIHEQPDIVEMWLDRYCNDDNFINSFIDFQIQESLINSLEQIQILACGTSRHAAMVGAYLLEQFSGIPTTVYYASEFRYNPPPLIPNTLTIGVSQSGETADTLAALAMENERRSLQKDPKFVSNQLGITNRPNSSLGRQVQNIIDIGAGIEIGVAATKTFLAQMLSFYGLAILFASRKNKRSSNEISELINELRLLPEQLRKLVLHHDKLAESLAYKFVDTQDVIFLGRGINYPIALEGALKLKEISYIHAQGYPAGELKHGPIALLDRHVPVVSIAVPGKVYEKVLSNSQEAKARDAQLIGVCPQSFDTDLFDTLLAIPLSSEWISPLLSIIPLQLFSYHIAAHKGLDVDQPRNLAKSVTVE